MPPTKRQRSNSAEHHNEKQQASPQPTKASSPTNVKGFAGFFCALNVGGHNRIKMDALVNVFLGCGAVACTTHIQSGNVAFTLPTGLPDIATFSSMVCSTLKEAHHVNTEMIVRDCAELRRITACAQEAASAVEHKKWLQCFLFAEPCVPPDGGAEACSALVGPAESVHAGSWRGGKGREMYVYCGGGVASSKLNVQSLKKRMGASRTPTARNADTLLATLSLVEHLER